MKKETFISSIATSLLMVGCNAPMTTVDYQVADHYFVRNDAPQQVPFAYTSQAQFDSIFGQATTMGPNGKPTPIDWSRQMVLAHVLPETDKATRVRIKSIKAGADSTLYVATSVHQDSRPLSYTTRPCTILIIDGRYQGYRIVER